MSDVHYEMSAGMSLVGRESGEAIAVPPADQFSFSQIAEARSGGVAA
jgi:hypothetical protein